MEGEPEVNPDGHKTTDKLGYIVLMENGEWR